MILILTAYTLPPLLLFPASLLYIFQPTNWLSCWLCVAWSEPALDMLSLAGMRFTFCIDNNNKFWVCTLKQSAMYVMWRVRQEIETVWQPWIPLLANQDVVQEVRWPLSLSLSSISSFSSSQCMENLLEHQLGVSVSWFTLPPTLLAS